MAVKDFFRKDLVFVNKKFKDKNTCLQELAMILQQNKYAKDSKKVLELALKREGEFSTGIGNAIAIPHIRDDVMNESVVTFVKTDSLDWQSLDGVPVKFIFFISMSKSGGESSHLETIAELSKMFMNENFTAELEKVNGYDSLIKLLDKYSDDKKEETKSSNNNQNLNNSSNGYDVVAITACPTGIAHTFMAAQSLEKAAKEMNIKIKVETQGTDGQKNTLTADDIKNAKGVIIAVDKVIDLSRFAGKENVLEMGTKAVIKDPKKEINKILNNEGKKMEGNAASANSQSFSDGSDLMSFKGFGKRLYKGIMSGVSYMLPFVVFGGIMIALAFLIDINNAGKENFGSVNDVAKWFKALGDLSFGLIVPILSAYIAYGLVGKFGLLPGFLCGFISIGNFLFSITPETGEPHWLSKPGEIAGTVGESGFFGGIIGAFITAALLIVFVKYVFAKLPQSLNGIKNILFIPLIGTITIVAVFWIANIPLIYVNFGFTKLLELINSQSYLLPLLGLLLGIMMASDLGGPINKAAYLFAIATISGGTGSVAMASTMAGGMVPPLGIALSATFFKNLYTKEQRQAGFTNYIMGLSFVSEGAIPFTAENPKVIVPSNIIGGGIAGLLAGLFQITLNAPHGGVFVFALVESNLFSDHSVAVGAGIGLYILSIVLGSVASMLSIWILSKVFSKKSTEKSSKQNNVKTSKFWTLKFVSKKQKNINA